MLLNKEKRIKYLGFDDLWFIIIGNVILSFITDYLFNNCSFLHHPFLEALISWSISLFFSFCNWFIMRGMMIFLRKKFPAFGDSLKRIVLMFFTIVTSVLLVDFIGNIFLNYSFGDTYHPMTRSKLLLPIILISTMTLAIYEAIYYYVRLKKSVLEEEQAKRVIVQGQLNALRNQARPHFLFNSLNALRDIIDENSKEEAKQFVDKLAEVYRFILESGNENLIPLREELKFAKSYVHIQTERFGNNLQLNWNISEEYLQALVVPMSIQLLLENAIKHNVISKAKPLIIQVSIQENYLVVDNKIALKSSQVPSTKMGLKNIEKRYALISNQSPRIENDGHRFIVSLPLLTASDQKNNSHGYPNH